MNRAAIKKLEFIARKLEPSESDRVAARKEVVTYSEKFLNNIEHIKAFNEKHDKGKGLWKAPISEKPLSIKKAIRLIEKSVDHPALNPASGGHFGYIPGGGLYYSSLSDYLAAITNRYAGIFYAGPGAVRMENILISWTAKISGYPSACGGNLTSGGSIANLIGICTARDAMNINSKNIRQSVIYLSPQVHHSINKALRIAGLGECIVRHLVLDDRYRIDSKKLEQQIRDDKKKKLNPFLMIASAGTTDVGAVDPLKGIGIISKKHKMWYAIDAAYGGYFMLTKAGKAKLQGIELSDSLSIDPHKGLFLPYGLGIVLVKDRKKMSATHFYQANYMQDSFSEIDEPSPCDLSPELTKHFRGLRMWLPLQLHGLSPFRACLEEKLLLTKYFYREIKNLGFETGPEPDLTVVTYRFVPDKGDADVFNKKLLEAVKRDGRVFISSTVLNGKFTLRFACLSFRSHLATVDCLLEILKSAKAKLERA